MIVQNVALEYGNVAGFILKRAYLTLYMCGLWVSYTKTA